MMQDNKSGYEARAKIFKALGHPARLLIVDRLSEGGKSVLELTEMVGSDISTVSRHLSVLKSEGLVRDVKQGARVFYHLCITCLPTFLNCLDGFLSDKHCRGLGFAEIAGFKNGSNKSD